VEGAATSHTHQRGTVILVPLSTHGSETCGDDIALNQSHETNILFDPALPEN